MGSVIGQNPTTVYNKTEGDKFNADTTLVTVSCCVCGITYAIPAKLDRSARKYHGDSSAGWWLCCPLGHTWGYTGQTDEEKLRERLAAERDRAARLASQRDQLQASLRGTRANAARTRKELKSVKTRVAAGTCPCCSRTFQQLSRHMKSQHPDYAASRLSGDGLVALDS